LRSCDITWRAAVEAAEVSDRLHAGNISTDGKACEDYTLLARVDGVHTARNDMVAAVCYMRQERSCANPAGDLPLPRLSTQEYAAQGRNKFAQNLGTLFCKLTRVMNQPNLRSYLT
jgi:hypothetical protein